MDLCKLVKRNPNVTALKSRNRIYASHNPWLPQTGSKIIVARTNIDKDIKAPFRMSFVLVAPVKIPSN